MAGREKVRKQQKLDMAAWYRRVTESVKAHLCPSTSPSFALMTASYVELQNEMIRRNWNQSFSLFINHSLQRSYYVTLSSLIVLSGACRDMLLRLGGRTDWVVVLLLNLINFWVLSGACKAGMPRSGPQLSQVFCPTRQKHGFFQGKCEKEQAGQKTRLVHRPQGPDLGTPAVKAELFCSQNKTFLLPGSIYLYHFLGWGEQTACVLKRRPFYLIHFINSKS